MEIFILGVVSTAYSNNLRKSYSFFSFTLSVHTNKIRKYTLRQALKRWFHLFLSVKINHQRNFILLRIYLAFFQLKKRKAKKIMYIKGSNKLRMPSNRWLHPEAISKLQWLLKGAIKRLSWIYKACDVVHLLYSNQGQMDEIFLATRNKDVFHSTGTFLCRWQSAQKP